MVITNKTAKCIRNTSTWSKLKAEYKFDTSAFNKNTINANLALISPKMNVMLKKIKELDEKDLRDTGTLNKHIIYSDVAGVYGAKMIASVLIADGFNLVYNNGLKMIDNKDLENDKSFALLTTSTVYKKPLTVGLKKNILQELNKRPDNIFGKNIRFLVLDSGFKEGIDVFDVKYIHLLEPLITKSEQTQVIGRGTRYCGQAGLPFIPSKGWELNVFRYNMMYNDDESVHQLYLKNSNINISSLNFTADIEDLLIASAVDIPLTENIHNFKNNRFIKMTNILNKSDKSTKKDKNFIFNIIKGKIFTNDKKIDCKKGCSGDLENIDNGLLIIAALHIEKPELTKALNDKNSKELLCSLISKEAQFCNTINTLLKQPIKFLKIYEKNISKSLEIYRRKYSIHKNNYKDAVNFINMFKDLEYKAEPPKTKLNYIDLNNYIKKHFKAYIWDKLEIKNKCIENNNESSIIKYTNTQKFVKDFLTPESPYKGFLLYHSVGSGKTCTAIATATSTFDKMGYTILWVTRHTLKEDIWKNMFDKICNVIIQEKVNKGLKIPSTRGERMKLLGENWIQPISYKQFTNMIQGKNKYYEEMVKRNGKEDPFKKTLIIIDEIHKIYSNSLSTLEKPDPQVLQTMIQNSYDKSGKNSLKLLLMSATPITEDTMSVIKILNLMIEKKQQFPEDFNEFKKKYCKDDGIFTDDGAIKFLNNSAGLVSYIDRSNDVSQFAYPIINDIIVKLDTVNKKNEVLEDLENKLIDLDEELFNNKNLNKKEIKEINKDIKETVKKIKKIHKETNKKLTIIDHINNCFDKEDKEPREIKRKSVKKIIDCPSGKIINPKTGRCIKDPSIVKIKICPDGKIINPKTGRCIKIKV